MTGYTRKSIASIINGSNITAPPLNAEFDQLLAAFHATTGHTHDGTSAGAGPKINLATSVSGLLPAVNGGSGGSNKLDATANPTIANDNSQNYAVGSIWINVSTDKIFICVNSTSNAAQWRQIVANDGLKIVPETTNTWSQMTSNIGLPRSSSSQSRRRMLRGRLRTRLPKGLRNRD